jgi:predicted dehydrogenase
MENVKWLLVGAGDIARKRVAAALAGAAGSELVAVCDMVRENAGALAAQVAGIDQRLQGLLTSGEFVWEAAVAHVYPREEYWYLYALPVG